MRNSGDTYLIKMARFGLIGNPIAHSKSPSLFAAAYPDKDTYELIEAENLEKSLQIFMQEDFKGINVTSPYKDLVMEHVAFPDRISYLLGSANVLIKGETGKDGVPLLYSYNTDYYGVKNSVTEFLSKRGERGGASAGSVEKVLVVGAGGAGKAAALAMKDMGYDVFLANRSAGKIAEFASAIGVEYVPLDMAGKLAKEADIIVYSLSFLIDQLKGVDLSGKAVFEANYAKPSLAPECGVVSGVYIDGKWWLYHQAIPAFELFTGRRPNLLAMRRIIGIK